VKDKSTGWNQWDNWLGVLTIIRNVYRGVEKRIKQLVGNNGRITWLTAKINWDMVKQQGWKQWDSSANATCKSTRDGSPWGHHKKDHEVVGDSPLVRQRA